MKVKLILKHRGDYDYFLVSRTDNSEALVASLNPDEEMFEQKLSTKNCNEIFGVVDVEKLADERFDKSTPELEYRNWAFKVGFNKAMELNKDKVFTLEDMRQAYNDGMNNIDGDGCSIDNPDEDFLDTINTIQQPSEIEVEIEMREDYLMWKHSDIEKMSDCLVPKLDSEGCLILKKI